MSKPEQNSSDRRFLALWLIAGLFEVPALALMLGFPLPISGAWGIAAHILCALLIFCAPPHSRGYFAPTRHWAKPLALIALFLPGIGWTLAGWLVLSHGDAPFAKDAYRFEDDGTEDVNPLAGMGSPGAIRRELSDALDVVPAVDALLSAAPALKRGAIETLARIRTSEAIGWIFKARTDPDPEVRFYATSALTRLKRDFETSIQASENEAFQRPGESSAQLALQRVRYEYAVSGILDPDARIGLLQECRAHLDASAARSLEAARLLYLVERRLDPERALPVLNRLEAAQPERRLWIREKAELLFALGRYGAVRSLLTDRRADLEKEREPHADDLEWRSTLFWWING